MANTMIDFNKVLFEVALKQATVEVHPCHCIRFENPEEDRIVFHDLKIDNSKPILYSSRFIEIIDAEKNRYFVITEIDFETVAFDTNHIAVHNENRSAFFLFLGGKSVLNVKKDSIETFSDNRLFKDDDDSFEYMTNLKGEVIKIEGSPIRIHYLDDLEEYYEKFTIFKITPDGDFAKATSWQIVSYLMAKQTKYRWLPFEDLTIDAYETMTQVASPNIPYELICESLLSNKWKYAYKDLYRCIEGLYTYPHVTGFRHDISCNTVSLKKLASSIERKLGWRPTEIEAFSLLLKEVDTSILDTCIELFTDEGIKSWDSDVLAIQQLEEASGRDMHKIRQYQKIIHEKKAGYAAKKLYLLRNSLVHFRPALDTIDKDDTEWNKIIVSMLALIRELSPLYDEFFVEEDSSELTA